jgi:hypothetical protein
MNNETEIKPELAEQTENTAETPAQKEKKEARRAYRDLLRDPRTRDINARPFLPIKVELMSYQINGMYERLFNVFELYSYAIYHIGVIGGQEQSRAAVDVAIKLVGNYDEKITKELSRFKSMAIDMGYTEKVMMRGSKEVEIMCGSPVATQFAKSMVKTDELFELLNRLWLNGLINTIQKDNGIRQYVRLLKSLVREISTLSNRTYIGYRRAQAKASVERAKTAEKTSEVEKTSTAETTPSPAEV